MTPRAVAPPASMKTHKAVTRDGSAISRYADVMVGQHGWRALLRYEFCMLFRNTPGALGLFLRKTFWPKLFAGCGRGVLFGTGISIRHPNRIRLGANVVISDNCILDGRHTEEGPALTVGDDWIVSRGVV